MLAVIVDERDTLIGEAYLLLEKGEKRIESKTICCELAKLPEGYRNQFDVDFMMREALTAAQGMLAARQLAEFEKRSDWNVFAAPQIASPIEHKLSDWVLALEGWTKELNEITRKTSIRSLGEWLNTVVYIRDAIITDDTRQ